MKLVEPGRLDLDRPVQEWIAQALSAVWLIGLTPRIAVASTRLPQPSHRDPADQIIVATARAYNMEVFAVDRKILAYEHVRAVKNG